MVQKTVQDKGGTRQQYKTRTIKDNDDTRLPYNTIQNKHNIRTRQWYKTRRVQGNDTRQGRHMTTVQGNDGETQVRFCYRV